MRTVILLTVASVAVPCADMRENSIGMRLVRIPTGEFQMGEPRAAGWEQGKPLERRSAQSWMQSATHGYAASQPARLLLDAPAEWREPVFLDPVPLVRPALSGFMGWHNHQPTVTWLRNGDLLAAFFSTHQERSRQMVIMATRLRAGAKEWDPASIFVSVPDLNLTGCSLFNDGRRRRLFLHRLDEAQHWGKLALVMRSSRDNGATWTKPAFADPEHGLRHQAIHGMIRLRAEETVLHPADTLAEIGGYPAETQTPDGVIHLLSSGLHYRFNRAWLEQPLPAAQ